MNIDNENENENSSGSVTNAIGVNVNVNDGNDDVESDVINGGNDYDCGDDVGDESKVREE